MAPDPDLTLQPQPAPVQLDEAARQGEAQPGALRLAGPPCSLGLLELLEDPLVVFRRNARPRVPDLDLHRSVVCRCPDPDAAPLRRELDGIPDKVDQDLL